MASEGITARLFSKVQTQDLQHGAAHHTDWGKAVQRPRGQQARQGVVAAQPFQDRPQQPQPQVVAMLTNS